MYVKGTREKNRNTYERGNKGVIRVMSVAILYIYTILYSLQCLYIFGLYL